MRTRQKREIAISIGLLILPLLLFAVGWPINRVRITGRSMYTIEEYEDYYFFAKSKEHWFKIWQTSWVKDVYFLPGQKRKLLKKIKEDVNTCLEELIAEYSDVYYKYEISDDFMDVFLYKKSAYKDEEKYSSYGEPIGRIQMLINLYQNIKEGHSVSSHGHGIKRIEP